MEKKLRCADLEDAVERGLVLFVEAARAALGDDLMSVVLYGSAASREHRLASDVNVIMLLRNFVATRVDALREPLRMANAAIRLEVMFLLDQELDEAVEAFADKFADVRKRHRVLHGVDLSNRFEPSRRAQVRQVRQTLLNLALRQRQRYLLASLREEQATLAVAELAGPIRACAATLRSLEEKSALTPKQALLAYATESCPSESREWLELVSQAREQRELPQGEAGPLLLRLLDLTIYLHGRALAVRDE